MSCLISVEKSAALPSSGVICISAQLQQDMKKQSCFAGQRVSKHTGFTDTAAAAHIR